MGRAKSVDGELTIQVVNPEFLDFCWSDIEPFIVRSLHFAEEFGIESVRTMIASGEAFALVARRGETVCAVLVARVAKFPRFKAAHVIAMSGRGVVLDNKVFDELKAQLRSIGCSKIQFMARPSIARLYRKIGMQSDISFFRVNL